MENKEEFEALIGRLKESGTLMESAQKAYGSRAKIFSNNLKRNMSKNNISMHCLCKVVGTDDFKKIAGRENISDTVVNGWVKGWRLPSSSQMFALSVLFGVEVSDFFQITKCNDEKILAPDSEIKCVLSYLGEREIRVKFKNVLSDGTDLFLPIKMVLNTDEEVESIMIREDESLSIELITNAAYTLIAKMSHDIETKVASEEHIKIMNRFMEEWSGVDFSLVKIIRKLRVGKRSNTENINYSKDCVK